MRCLLDVNVLVDLAASRHPWVADAQALVDAAAQRGVELVVTAASLPTFMYVTRSESTLARAFAALDNILLRMTVIPTDASAIFAARSMRGRDFEDNVQIACAVAAGCDLIVTRNLSDFRDSPIRAVDPAEAARLITAGP